MVPVPAEYPADTTFGFSSLAFQWAPMSHGGEHDPPATNSPFTVAVLVGVLVGVDVLVLVTVRVSVAVYVSVTVLVAVAVLVAVLVGVDVRVEVDVAVLVTVAVTVGVLVREGVHVGVFATHTRLLDGPTHERPGQQFFTNPWQLCPDEMHGVGVTVTVAVLVGVSCPAAASGRKITSSSSALFIVTSLPSMIPHVQPPNPSCAEYTTRRDGSSSRKPTGRCSAPHPRDRGARPDPRSPSPS